MNLYFGVATRNRYLCGVRGSKEDCLLLPCFWADLDVRDGERHKGEKNYPATRVDALALVKRFPLPPTVVVWTGGGVHVYWKLLPALTVQDGEPLLPRLKVTVFRLADEFGVEVDSVFQPAMMMRLPGSVNRKATPVPVEVIFSDWSRVYHPEEWDVVLDELPPIPLRRSPKRPVGSPSRLRTPGSAQYSDWPERDQFNANHTVHDVLLGTRWTVRRQTPKLTEYIRPDKTTEGNSATVYANEPDRAVVWSDAAGLENMRGYDAWGLHVFLNHGGDFGAATQASKTRRGRRGQQNTAGGSRLRLRRD